MENGNKVIICVPGQRLCKSDKNKIAGYGTYEARGYIYSKLAGIVKLVNSDNAVTVKVDGMARQCIVPAPGHIVTAVITSLNQRFCKCLIKCIGDIVLPEPFRGCLRKEEVQAFDRCNVEMYKSFHPGDIILARVLPMTEGNVYHLTTAENELGVVRARSEDGVLMIPISWTQMQCPKTLIKEYRKVAKIIPQHLAAENEIKVE